MKDVSAVPLTNQNDCCGCELCQVVCPYGAITMIPNEEGFLFPSLNANKCRSCHSCERKCPVNNVNRNAQNKGLLRKRYYAGYANDSEIVKHSSSGGIWTLLAECFLNQHEKAYVVGSVWAEDFKQVKYSYTNTALDLERFRRSKYSQSLKGSIYEKVKKWLQDEYWVLYTGTPCEVAALQSFLSRDYEKLVLVDFVCQGPESPKAVKQYMDYLERTFKSKISYVSLREVGGPSWIPQWMKIVFENGKTFFEPFYQTELGESLHTMQRVSCYSCRFTLDNHLSDITIGDYHGADPNSNYYNRMGTSIIVINSDEGKHLFDEGVISRATLVETDLDALGKTNPRLVGTWNESKYREKYSKVFCKSGVIKAAWSVWGKKRILKSILRRWKNRLIK